MQHIQQYTDLVYFYEPDDFDCYVMCNHRALNHHEFEAFLGKCQKWLHKNKFDFYNIQIGDWQECPLDAPEDVRREKLAITMPSGKIEEWIKEQKERNWKFIRNYTINTDDGDIDVIVLDVPNKFFKE